MEFSILFGTGRKILRNRDWKRKFQDDIYILVGVQVLDYPSHDEKYAWTILDLLFQDSSEFWDELSDFSGKRDYQNVDLGEIYLYLTLFFLKTNAGPENI